MWSFFVSSGPLDRPLDLEAGRELPFFKEDRKGKDPKGKGLAAKLESESSRAGFKRRKGRKASMAPGGAALAPGFSTFLVVAKEQAPDLPLLRKQLRQQKESSLKKKEVEKLMKKEAK